MSTKKAVVTVKIEVPCYTAREALKHANDVAQVLTAYHVKAVGVTGA